MKRSRTSKKQLEARIVVKPAREGKREILCYDPQTGREIPTGLCVWPNQVETEVRKLKRQLEQAGNYCTVKEM